MRYKALATDYDETLASNGKVSSEALNALQRLKESGRKLILVTGREMDDLLNILPQIELFDRVVAENGGVLYRPAHRQERLLTERPSVEFISALHKAGVTTSVGRTVVASHEPHEKTILQVIHDLELELHLVFNKGSLMVLPSGVNKASGLFAAAHELGLSVHNIVGVGDAENDHAFLGICEFSAAVANALPSVKKRADLVTSSDHSAGVIQVIEGMITTDLREFEPGLVRHRISLGTKQDGAEFGIPPYGTSLLLAGTPGSGKTTFATSLLERLTEQNYQFCIIDPEGDYHKFEGAVVLGDAKDVPSVEEVMEVLQKSDQSAVVSLLRLSHEERPGFFKALFPKLQDMRERTGRPHWIVIDETHHLLPSSADGANVLLPQKLQGTLMITVHPDHLFPGILSSIDIMVAAGESSVQVLENFSQKLGKTLPPVEHRPAAPGEYLAWDRRAAEPPFLLRTIFPMSKGQRHNRKYAEGDLGPKRSFYFRGPEAKMNLKAQNLMVFVQLADGVDRETWLYHVRRHDISRWIRGAIRDDELATILEGIERTATSATQSRAAVRQAIQQRYTLPA